MWAELSNKSTPVFICLVVWREDEPGSSSTEEWGLHNMEQPRLKMREDPSAAFPHPQLSALVSSKEHPLHAVTLVVQHCKLSTYRGKGSFSEARMPPSGACPPRRDSSSTVWPPLGRAADPPRSAHWPDALVALAKWGTVHPSVPGQLWFVLIFPA